MRQLNTLQRFSSGSYSSQNQKGAVLIVSLVLLLVMTLIGVASIDSSQLQSQMARNSLFSQNLHQASLNEIQAQREALKGTDYLEEVTTSQVDILTAGHPGITKDSKGIVLTDSSSITHDPDDNYTQSGAVAFIGNTAPPSGYSLGLYIGKSYEVYAATVVAGTSSESDQTQGLTRVAPENN